MTHYGMVSMTTAIFVLVTWQHATVAQKPFSPYDVGPFYYHSRLSAVTHTKRPRSKHPVCLLSGSLCDPWDIQAPCCEGAICRTYANGMCLGIGECWCKEKRDPHDFHNWYRKRSRALETGVSGGRGRRQPALRPPAPPPPPLQSITPTWTAGNTGFRRGWGSDTSYRRRRIRRGDRKLSVNRAQGLV